MSKQLYIHIGFHKTGSSSLQETIFEQREILLEKGLCYPAPLENYPSHADLAWVLNPELPKWARLSYQKNQIIEHYKHTLGESECEKILLSSEDFSIFDYSLDDLIRVHSLFKDYNPKIICYFRRPINLIISMYCHAVYEGVTFSSVSEYLAQEVDLYALDYSARLDNWCVAFGAENVMVGQYEDLVTKSSVYLDIMEKMGVEPTNTVPKVANVSPNVLLLDAFVAANRLDNSEQKVTLREVLARASKGIPKIDAESYLFTNKELSLLHKLEDYFLSKLYLSKRINITP